MPEDEREDWEIGDLLRALDHEPPRITPQDVIQRARRPRATAIRMAAGIAAALTLAGVAYALPGSPVRIWVRSIGERSQSRTVVDAARTAAGPPAEASAGGGLVFDPAEPLTIRIQSGSSGHLLVSPTEGTRLVVRMVAGAGRFTSEPNELGVRLTAPDTLELLVPRSARSVAVTYQGTRLFTQRGADRSAMSAPDSAGLYHFDLGAGSP